MPIVLLIINSSLASPTPAFGMLEKSNALEGLPTFIIILTGVSGKLLTSEYVCSNFKVPL